MTKVKQFFIERRGSKRRSSVALIHTGRGPTCYGLVINGRRAVPLPFDERDAGYVNGGSTYRVACRRAWDYLSRWQKG